MRFVGATKIPTQAMTNGEQDFHLAWMLGWQARHEGQFGL